MAEETIKSVEDVVPGDAVERGGSGVRVVPGGYRQVGTGIELPSVSGSRSFEKQDNLTEEDLTLEIISVDIDKDGETFVPVKSDSVLFRKDEKGGWTHTPVESNKPTPTEANPAPVGGDSTESAVYAPVVPTTGTAVEHPAEKDEPSPVNLVVPVNESFKIAARLIHRSGFSISLLWDLVLIEEPQKDRKATTMVLALSGESGETLVLPEGEYKVIVSDNIAHDADGYENIYYGEQRFTYRGVTYFIFIMQLDAE
jgi:hypothetical protein